MQHLGRKVPVRAAFVAVAVSVYAFSVIMQSRFMVDSQGMAESLIGMIAVAILGDTYRPSGRVAAVASSGGGGGGGEAGA